jgi:hypothetical protein
VIFYVEPTPTGLIGTVNSPDAQGAVIAVRKIESQGRDLTLDVPRVRAGFRGKLARNGRRIHGTWTQDGRKYPLTLSHVSRVEDTPRPQTPRSPFPYREEHVTFASFGSPDVQLAGTFMIPEGSGPFPGIVLIAGSGPNSRDEELFRHKVFQVWGDYFARRGFAVLRYDKRGVGESGGTYDRAAVADFGADARGAFEWSLQRPELDPRRIGLVGHSEGSILAPAVAATAPSTPAFLVLVGAPGVPGDRLLLAQNELVGRVAGISEEELAKQRAGGEALDRAIQAEIESPELKGDLAKLLKAQHVEHPERAAQWISTPWFRSFITTDPAPILRRVRCPVLAVTGGLDLQVPAALNLPPIAAALKEAGNRDATTMELPGLNHLLQPAKTGSPVEYGEIEITSDPAALALMADWMAERAKLGTLAL